MQQGMLYHRLGGAGGVDIEQVIGELREPVDVKKFEQAWREVMARHAALRTAFESPAGADARQVVYPASEVPFGVRYAEFADEHLARLGVQDYLAADRREGFATLAAPLLRVALFRAGPAHFWFVTTYHHLLLDARSMTVMFREVLEIHDALVRGDDFRLPAARSCRGYIEWLAQQDADRAQTFWREQLRGFSAPTPLPEPLAANGASPAVTAAAGELAFRLSAEMTNGLRALARSSEVTLNTVVQAAWALVLGRHAGEDDVVFGAVRAGRNLPVEGVDGMIGLLINTVPVRVRLPADATIAAWLRDVRQPWVAMREVEHTPLIRIQQWSDVPAGRPLFETILSYQEPSWDAALHALGGAWSQRQFDIIAQPNYPLALEVLAGATLTVKFIFDRARYSDDAVARVMARYRIVLEALAGGRATTVGELPLLTAAEQQQILVAWNNTAAEYLRDRCVHADVAAHAQRAPLSIAVSDAYGVLNYGELNARANQLAHHLQRLGVQRDRVVAVCMNRSTEMIVAWLGVLKAGGAFVPLDPAYPQERLAFQLEDSGARVLLTQPALRPVLSSLDGACTVLELAGGGRGFEPEPDGNPAHAGSPRDLAYVIYTSGSTGLPKGVEIEHRALMNLVTWHQRTYAVTSADRATHLASPAFDASVWEIWPYLAAGASIHIPDDETRLSPALLWRWMAARRITVSFMPTPLAEAAMNEAWPESMALRALLTGGDKLKRRPPANFPCAFVNHYGPTESTVVATCGTIDAAATGADTPSIGRPIANTQVYVLDRHLRAVPVGVVGELYLGGESLARGYRGRPELTAERFLPHPFDRTPGARVYRTGDLVRWNSAGEIEFLGRSDGQVKVRGCRIELGEIEAAIHLHPAARESVVLARPDHRGQLQLVAYVRVSRDTAPVTEAMLLEFLRSKLPAYMVPSAFVLLDAWPLTPNGKIDRNALPAPEPSADACGSATAPRTTLEATIAHVWADVLGRTSVGLGDNFFDLGGHSLLAAQVVSRLNATLAGAVSVRALFDQPTLAAFAREVEQQLAQPATPRPAAHRLKRRLVRAETEVLQPN